MVVIALAIIAGSVYGSPASQTGFLPIEDQGYMLASGATARRRLTDATQKVLEKVTEIARKTRASPKSLRLPAFRRRKQRTARHAGVAYIILKDWSETRQG